jgi:hypothetical protein
MLSGIRYDPILGSIIGDNAATTAILDRFLENVLAFNIREKL